MADPYLMAVARHAEAGGDPFAISLTLTSGVVVTGFVRRSEFFATVTRQLAHDRRLALTAEKKRKPETFADADAHADQAARALRDIDDDLTDVAAITLSDIKMLWNNGDGLTIPTMRLRLDAVASWWASGTATAFKGAKDAGGFVGVGVAFPIGD